MVQIKHNATPEKGWGQCRVMVKINIRINIATWCESNLHSRTWMCLTCIMPASGSYFYWNHIFTSSQFTSIMGTLDKTPVLIIVCDPSPEAELDYCLPIYTMVPRPGYMVRLFSRCSERQKSKMCLKMLYGTLLSHLRLIFKISTKSYTVELRCLWRNVLLLWYLHTCCLLWCRHRLHRFLWPQHKGSNIHNAYVCVWHWCRCAGDMCYVYITRHSQSFVTGQVYL